jgi:hypothetical protein
MTWLLYCGYTVYFCFFVICHWIHLSAKLNGHVTRLTGNGILKSNPSPIWLYSPKPATVNPIASSRNEFSQFSGMRPNNRTPRFRSIRTQARENMRPPVMAEVYAVKTRCTRQASDMAAALHAQPRATGTHLWYCCGTQR